MLIKVMLNMDKTTHADSLALKYGQASNPAIQVSTHVNPAKYLLKLEGTASAEDYAQALREVQFNSIGEMAGESERNVSMVAQACYSSIGSGHQVVGVCSDITVQCVTVRPVNEGYWLS